MTRCNYQHVNGYLLRCPRHPKRAALRWAPNRAKWVLDSNEDPEDWDFIDHRAAAAIMLGHLTGAHVPTIPEDVWEACLSMAALADPDAAPLYVVKMLWEHTTSPD